MTTVDSRFQKGPSVAGECAIPGHAGDVADGLEYKWIDR